jgi:hypothetical protein
LLVNGARIQNAPAFLKMMAAQMKNEGGSRQTARAIYEQMYNEAQDAQTRENAAVHLLKLDSMDERDAIRAGLEDFQKKNNRCAANWREAFPVLKNLKTARGATLRFDAESLAPVDPTNVPYVLRAANQCDVAVNSKISKIPNQ